MSPEDLRELVERLIKLEHENEWVEFKVNQSEPDRIGQYISALSNSAALHEQRAGYLVWGIENETHKVVGTSFRPLAAKVSNEDLLNWLTQMLNPRVLFTPHQFRYGDKDIALLEIQAASHTAVRWKGVDYIRVGSQRRKLQDHPERARALWSRLTETAFENGVALSKIPGHEVLQLLAYPSYFDLTEEHLPTGTEAILDRLASERLILRVGPDRYDVTNVGAILFAKDINEFDRLKRKTVRVVVYAGEDRTRALREQIGVFGYAAGFEGLMSFIGAQLPQQEVIEGARRQELPAYPDLAVRELVANALIHQDLTVTGTGPMVEIFSDRVEISNPGMPLIEVLRFLDAPPKSRNEVLAGLMRRMKFCEERGSGVDKVIFELELNHLPAPDFATVDSHTRVTLFGPRPLSEMTKADRNRACYYHAAIQQVSGKVMTNSTLRDRFKIEKKNHSQVSRMIREAQEEGLIKRADPESKSRKHATYVPFWA